MSRIKKTLDHKRIRRLIWLVFTLFVLLGYSLQSVVVALFVTVIFLGIDQLIDFFHVIIEEGASYQHEWWLTDTPHYWIFGKWYTFPHHVLWLGFRLGLVGITWVIVFVRGEV